MKTPSLKTLGTIGLGLVGTGVLVWGIQKVFFPVKPLPNVSEGFSSLDSGGLGQGIHPEEAEVIARAQLEFMNQLGTGDVNEMIVALSPLSGNDLKKVYNAFGLVCYNGFTKCHPVDEFLGTGDDLDLFSWYIEELDSEELEVMNSIWQRTGLPLPF